MRDYQFIGRINLAMNAVAAIAMGLQFGLGAGLATFVALDHLGCIANKP